MIPYAYRMIPRTHPFRCRFHIGALLLAFVTFFPGSLTAAEPTKAGAVEV